MFKSDRSKLKEIAKHIRTDKTKFSELLKEYLDEQDRKTEEYFKVNPIDAPNHVLTHAIIEGIAFYNDKVLSVGDYHYLMEIGLEKLHIWTYEEDVVSILISEVSPDVKKTNLWKTAASILDLGLTLNSSLEHFHELTYDWIYRFEPSISIKKQHYLKNDEFSLQRRSIMSLIEFKNIMNILELLVREDKFYVATQNIIAARDNHEFCQICAFTPEHYRMHHDQEPKIWERSAMIPKMETAIVQSTRAIEALIGKPGDKGIPSKLYKTKTRWNEHIELDPDEEFKMVGKSYVDYYYDLFDLRNYAAHSLGKLSFNMSRSLTIQVQSFAWLVISSYFKKNSVSNEEAGKILGVNNDLLEQMPKGFSSNQTKR